MPITVFSDPHLGRTMQAHTTPTSRTRLTQAIYNTTLTAMKESPVGSKVCAGDLFDKYQNSEAIIQQGLEVARWTTHIMAGNHDVTADLNKVGSLQLMAGLGGDATGCDIMLSTFGKSECYLKMIDGLDFVFVPHHTTDGLFQASLDDAVEWAHQRRVTRSVKPPAYLVLHCNYDSGYAVDETALNLTRKQAKWLLDAGFDYILIGHDHHPREDFDGRVIILGNVHPTGFGDISLKRVLWINHDGSHTFVPVWSPEGRYLVIDADHFGMVDIPEGVQFIDLVGKVHPEEVLQVAKYVRSLWADYEPLAIRNRVEIIQAGGGGAITHDFASIDKVVRDDLAEEPELLALFESYWAATVRQEEEGA